MKAYNTIETTPADSLTTLAHYEIQKSKFLTCAQHVESEAEAREFIAAVKKNYYDARHTCSAYVIGPDARLQKSNDDGEPGGTAGNPILECIKQNGLTDIVVTVTRYFGGIKLGAGGLIRAYSHAAALGLAACPMIKMQPYLRLSLRLTYDHLAPVQAYLRNQAELGTTIMPDETTETEYAADVTMHLLVTSETIDQHIATLTDMLAGRLSYKKDGETLAARKINRPEK